MGVVVVVEMGDRRVGGASLLYMYLQLQWNPINTVTNGPKKIGHINKVTVLKRVFYMKMYGGFCWVAKKSGHNNDIAVLLRWP